MEDADIVAAPVPRVRFRQPGDSSLNFELLGWNAQPDDGRPVTHELNCASYIAMRDNTIKISLPQRDLHLRAMPVAEI